MIDFSALTVAQARAYAQAYAEGAPARAAWLAEEVGASGGDPRSLQGPEGLRELWRWLTARVDAEGARALTLAVAPPADDPQAGPRPPWQGAEPNPQMSDGLLWIIDAVGCHLAALVMRVHPRARWELYRSPVRRDVDQRRTKLVGVGSPNGHAEPAQMVYGKVIGRVAWDEPWEADALSGLLDYMIGSEAPAAPSAGHPASAAVRPTLRSSPGAAGHAAAASDHQVPPLPGPVPDLPDRWDGYRDQLEAAGRVDGARQLDGLPGFGIVAGGDPSGDPPAPGERWIALFDDVRALVGDDAIDGLPKRLAAVDGVVRTDHRIREYVEVVGTLTDDQLRAWVTADLVLHGDLPDQPS